MDAIERQGRIEALAEDILTDQQLAAAYDQRRQENREALRRLREQAAKIKPTSRLATSTVNTGDFFIVVPTYKAQTVVEGAQKELEGAMDEVQLRLKKKIQLLSELEGAGPMAATAK
ncbi:hypothetical protein GGF46_002212 [Coemansia sp. RSA 552]|nr:hypothetical protein GGF46_002212 [Coemansia sp. RSA 552]